MRPRYIIFFRRPNKLLDWSQLACLQRRLIVVLIIHNENSRPINDSPDAEIEVVFRRFVDIAHYLSYDGLDSYVVWTVYFVSVSSCDLVFVKSEAFDEYHLVKCKERYDGKELRLGQ